ncbi:MAG: hypothetical protein JW910_09130 [Anaerolineae bacterium]|nr:hypothetical protein [Anaerolineae bacterium]
MEELLLGFCLGILTNVLAAPIVLYWQFSSSIAGYRVKHTVQATRDIVDQLEQADTYTGTLQNKYRYSLGVMIDAMAQDFRGGFAPDGPWPLLIAKPNPDKPNSDRWERFNKYVRPVMEDINAYSIIGWLHFIPLLNQLRILVELCTQLENTFSEIDRVLQYQGNLIRIDEGGISPVDANSFDHAAVRQLQSEFHRLYEVWCAWLEAIKPPSYLMP